MDQLTSARVPCPQLGAGMFRCRPKAKNMAIHSSDHATPPCSVLATGRVNYSDVPDL